MISSFMMFPQVEITPSACSGCQDQHPHPFLYNILSLDSTDAALQHNTKVLTCHCRRRRVVRLRNPNVTCQVASRVLVKTIRFLRSLPSFNQLPSGDQASLLIHCWAPVFILGLAQEKIAFEVTDEPGSSILRQILLGPGLADQPTLAGVHKLRTCLQQLWSLDLSAEEYAYLKGALLFNPAGGGLHSAAFVKVLHQEAHRALHETIHLLHPEDTTRLSNTLRAASALHTVSHSLITELFFKPLIGDTNMLRLLTDMLFVQ